MSVVSATAVKEGTVTDLNEEILNFYAEASEIWEEVVGEHMHHGYYDGSSNYEEYKQAQHRMIEECLAWAGIPEDDQNKPRTVLDVGCGLGGCARHLATKYKANVKAINISPTQIQRGIAITAEQGLSKFVSFQLGDALELPFADGEFDLVYSMECGEHLTDRRKYVQEMARVCAPNGRVLFCTCCHRELKPGELSLSIEEKIIMNEICDVWHIPKWSSASDYVKFAESVGLKNVRSADWENYAAPYWPALFNSTTSPKNLVELAKAGRDTMEAIIGIKMMIRGCKQGLFKFTVFTACKTA